MITSSHRIIVMGATSGIGNEIARIFIHRGCTVGIAGRRQDKLEELQQLAPERISIQSIDICQPDATQKLQKLIEQTGGMDLYVHCSGIGHQNIELRPEVELATLETNGTGFTRMLTAVFQYFSVQPKGHIAVISSIAGTRGLGVAPAYSATKRFQNIYMDALEQLSVLQKYNITFTDIRPGFVATALLNDNKHYPLLMRPEKVAQTVVHAIDRRQRIKTIDWRYQIIVFFWRLIPRNIWKVLPIRN